MAAASTEVLTSHGRMAHFLPMDRAVDIDDGSGPLLGHALFLRQVASGIAYYIVGLLVAYQLVEAGLHRRVCLAVGIYAITWFATFACLRPRWLNVAAGACLAATASLPFVATHLFIR